jgi:hypothetical protein
MVCQATQKGDRYLFPEVKQKGTCHIFFKNIALDWFLRYKIFLDVILCFLEYD